jgi:translocation and assembly module TamB
METPALSDISGKIRFDDNKLEVLTLKGKKGEGDWDLAGSMNWAAWLEDPNLSPALAMRLQARNAQVRIPVPYVESFDTTLNANVELTGDATPYALTGDVQILRAFAYREKTCQELLSEERRTVVEDLTIGSQSILRFDLNFQSEQGIILQTACLRARASANVRLTGNANTPLLTGSVATESGTVSFLKSHFNIQKMDLIFDNPVRLDPRLDIQLVSKIENYNISVSVDGTLSRRRTNLWVDPSSTPDGVSLTRSDIFRMLSSGRAPERAGTGGQAIASQVAAYGTSVLALDDSLTQAANRLTGGFIDTVELQPLIENGQTKWRARVSRSLGERLSLGLDIEQGQAVNNQSLSGTVYLNDSVNLLGGFDRRSEQTEQYYELSGGLRFRFGSNR